MAWLQSDAFLAVGDRYNGKAMSAGGDGERFALQLASALVNLDGSATGREFLSRENPFSHSRRNLVARMIGCDDPAVSAELQTACERLQASVDELGRGHVSDPDEARLKLNEAIEAELARMKDSAKAADSLNGLIDSHALDLESRAKGKAEIYNTVIRAAGSGGWLAVVFSAIALSAARGPATRREGLMLTGRALALTHGLGAEATKLLKQEALLLAARLRANPRYGNKVGLGRASDWLAREQQMQSLLETHVAQAAKGASIHGALRVQGLALVAEALAVMAGGGTRLAVKRDMRSAFEASGQLLSAVGSLRDIRVLLCEELVFKTVVPEVGHVAVFAKGTGLDQVVTTQLLELRAAAGRYAIAGTTIAIGLDALDAAKAGKSESYALMLAYITRSFGGLFAIAGIAIGMKTLQLALLVTRLNIAGLIVTTASTIAIEWLKDKAWQEWFKGQPFRVSKYSSDGTWVGDALQPSAHKSELQMMSRLDDAIQEAKGD